MNHSTLRRALLSVGLLASIGCVGLPVFAETAGESTDAASDKSVDSTPVESPSNEKEASSNPKATSAAPRASTLRSNALTGATGQLRLLSADSGEIGSVRVSFVESFFSGTGVLCPNCSRADGTVSKNQDSVGLSASRLQLSLTPTRFMEAFGSVQFQSTSNDQNRPRVIQTAGNVDFGAKFYMPYRAGRIYNLGALTDVSILAMSQSVGSATVNANLGGLATLDFRELQGKKNVPLRLNFNAIYRVDNSWRTAAAIESRRAELLASPQRTTRFERLGFDIRRTDILRIGIGGEFMFERYRPFAEWSIDLPINRQDHVCRVTALSAGDQCLSRDKQFSAIPSRLSLGLRAFPFKHPALESIGLLAAVDIGTGGTSNFIEEAIPELPWMAHIGVNYAFDAIPRVDHVVEVKEKAVVTQPALPPETFVAGKVVEKTADGTAGAPVANALVFFRDSDKPGFVTDRDGHFRTLELEPGSYAFRVTKEGYNDGDCTATVVAPNQPKDSAQSNPSSLRQVLPTEMTCNIARLPTSAIVTGTLRDSESTEYVARASISVTDERGRKVVLTTDEFGGFRFTNVPSGVARLQAEADGYLSNATELQLKPRDTATVQLSIHKRPKQTNIVVTAKELKLKKQIHFLHDSASIQTDSFGIVEELAEVLRTHIDITKIEIQGHTDDSGTAEHNQKLSRDRADAVRDALVVLGIAKDRLVAKGYGMEKPLVPNTNAGNRAKNRRVQLMIVGL